jgi:hypothetical protein
MLKKADAPASGSHLGPGRIVLALAFTALLTGTACEDKAIGRPCLLNQDVTPTQGAFTVGASDCPSRICVKPAVQAGVVPDQVDTGPYCSTKCNNDGDCNGQTRDPSNPDDKRCRKGFTCAMVFPKEPLCCEKICLCRDFFSASVGPATPDACLPDAGVSCS